MTQAQENPLAPTQAVIVSGQSKGAAVQVGERKYKVKQTVTLPQLQHNVGETIAIRFETPIRLGRDNKAGASMEKTPDVARVIDLSTGEEMAYVVSAMVKGNLETLYPGDAIVGKSFAIHKGARVEGRRYNNFAVVEIEAAA